MKKIYAFLCVLVMFFTSLMPAKVSAAETCTLPGVFWMQHVDVWPAPITPESQICGRSFVEVMQTPSGGIPWYVLAHEWIPAQLNFANSAVSECLGTVLADAEVLLNNCDFSQNPVNLLQYVSLAGILADYNNGILTGCTGCPDNAIVISPPYVCPQCPQCPSCCCPPCPESPDCICNCASRSHEKSSSKSCHHHRHCDHVKKAKGKMKKPTLHKKVARPKKKD